MPGTQVAQPGPEPAPEPVLARLVLVSRLGAAVAEHLHPECVSGLPGIGKG